MVGRLLAVGNSNPISEEMFVGNHRKAYEGKAVVVICSNGEPGDIVLTTAADGIPPVSVTVTTD